MLQGTETNYTIYKSGACISTYKAFWQACDLITIEFKRVFINTISYTAY